MRLCFVVLFIILASIIYSQTNIIDTLYCLPDLDGQISFNESQQNVIVYQNSNYYSVGDSYDWWMEDIVPYYGYLSFSVPEPPTGYHMFSAYLNYYIVDMYGNDSVNVYPQFSYPWGSIEPQMLIYHVDYGNSLSWDDVNPIVLDSPRTLLDSLTNGWQMYNITGWVQSDMDENRIYSQYSLRLLNDSDWDNYNDCIDICATNPSYYHYHPYIRIEYAPDSTNVVNEVALSLKQFYCYPNPFALETIVKVEVTKREKVHISIYNAKGQLIRTIVDMYLPKGQYHYIWDGNDEAGNVAKSGIYYFRLTDGITQKCVKSLYLK